MTDLSRIDPMIDGINCRAVIETPKGGRAKLAYDPETGAFALKRMLPDGMSFPLDFGFVPSTRAEDGDPIDILVLNDEPSAVGILTEVRLVGLIEAEQTEKGKTVRNDRLLAVAQASHLFAQVRLAEDLGPDFMRNLTQFWVNYDALRGVAFKVTAVRDAAAAVQAIERSRNSGAAS